MMTSDVVDTLQNQPVVTPASSERMIPESKVTELINERYKAALEKGAREERLRIEEEKSKKPSGLSEEETRKILREEMAVVVNQGMKQQTVQNFVSKIKGAELEDFPGLGAKVAKHANLLEPLLPYLEGVENTSAVTNFLVENPARAHQLKMMVMTNDLASVEDVIKEMAQTLKADATTAPSSTRQPHSHVKPSASAGGDKGERSIGELAKDKLYRC